MATWDDVSRIALSLPETRQVESGQGPTPHFDGYPAVLVRLDAIPVPELTELVTEALLDRAPKRLAKQYLGS